MIDYYIIENSDINMRICSTQIKKHLKQAIKRTKSLTKF